MTIKELIRQAYTAELRRAFNQYYFNEPNFNNLHVSIIVCDKRMFWTFCDNDSEYDKQYLVRNFGISKEQFAILIKYYMDLSDAFNNIDYETANDIFENARSNILDVFCQSEAYMSLYEDICKHIIAANGTDEDLNDCLKLLTFVQDECGNDMAMIVSGAIYNFEKEAMEFMEAKQ